MGFLKRPNIGRDTATGRAHLVLLEVVLPAPMKLLEFQIQVLFAPVSPSNAKICSRGCPLDAYQGAVPRAKAVCATS